MKTLSLFLTLIACHTLACADGIDPPDNEANKSNQRQEETESIVPAGSYSNTGQGETSAASSSDGTQASQPADLNEARENEDPVDNQDVMSRLEEADGESEVEYEFEEEDPVTETQPSDDTVTDGLESQILAHAATIDEYCRRSCEKEVECFPNQAMPAEECAQFCGYVDYLQVETERLQSADFLSCIATEVAVSSCLNELSCQQLNEYFTSLDELDYCVEEMQANMHSCEAFYSVDDAF